MKMSHGTRLGLAIADFAQDVRYNFDRSADFSKYRYDGFESIPTTGQTTTIHIGYVGLDVHDTNKQKLIWRGEVSNLLDENARPDKMQNICRKP